jgi:hypothetical protein
LSAPSFAPGSRASCCTEITRAAPPRSRHTTGDTRDAVARNGVLDSGAAFPPKRVTMGDLALTLPAVPDA